MQGSRLVPKRRHGGGHKTDKSVLCSAWLSQVVSKDSIELQRQESIVGCGQRMVGEGRRNAGDHGKVKVYRLNSDGGWDDLGTGILVCRPPPGGRPGLVLEVVPMAAAAGGSGGGGGGGVGAAVGPSPKPTSSAERVVFRHEVEAEDKYSRQDSTIITWPEGGGVVDSDVALSFAKEESSEAVWTRIVDARRALSSSSSSSSSHSPSDINGGGNDYAGGVGGVLSGAASPLSSSPSSSRSPSTASPASGGGGNVGRRNKVGAGDATGSATLPSPPPRSGTAPKQQQQQQQQRQRRKEPEDAVLSGIDADDMEDMLDVAGTDRHGGGGEEDELSISAAFLGGGVDHDADEDDEGDDGDIVMLPDLTSGSLQELEEVERALARAGPSAMLKGGAIPTRASLVSFSLSLVSFSLSLASFSLSLVLSHLSHLVPPLPFIDS